MHRLLLVLLLCWSSASVAAIWNITYPRPLTDGDQRTRYPVQLLALALDQTGVKYKLVPSDRIMLQSKSIRQLVDNREINVLWSMTDKSREEKLLPIRIPIYKGLIGWRLLLVRPESLARFSQVRDIDGLRKFKPIQGYDWPDTKILQSNGFDVATSKDYLGLFSMLSSQQGDFFPRSVAEIWSELDGESLTEELVVEPDWGLRYPTAMYYFVNKRNATLARLIQQGLEAAIENGKFDALFLQFHQPILDRARITERTFVELDNPLLPDETPLSRKELWFSQ